MPPGDAGFTVQTRLAVGIIFLATLTSSNIGLETLQIISGLLLITIFSLVMIFPLMPDPSDFSEESRNAVVLLLVPLSLLPASILGFLVGVTAIVSYDYLAIIAFMLTIIVIPYSETNFIRYMVEIQNGLNSLPKPHKLGRKNLLLTGLSISILAIISITQAGTFEGTESSLSILDGESMTFPEAEYDSEGVELIFSIDSNRKISYDLFYHVSHNGELVLSETIEISSQSGKSVYYEVPVEFSNPGEWRLEGTIISSDQNRQVFHDFYVKE